MGEVLEQRKELVKAYEGLRNLMGNMLMNVHGQNSELAMHNINDNRRDFERFLEDLPQDPTSLDTVKEFCRSWVEIFKQASRDNEVAIKKLWENFPDHLDKCKNQNEICLVIKEFTELQWPKWKDDQRDVSKMRPEVEAPLGDILENQEL